VVEIGKKCLDPQRAFANGGYRVGQRAGLWGPRRFSIGRAQPRKEKPQRVAGALYANRALSSGSLALAPQEAESTEAAQK
jgi:hypothetical protein